MEQDLILFSIEEGIATLTLNRPEVRNAFNDEVIRLITEQLHSVKDNPSVRALVIQGKGDHFCAGGDIQWMQKMSKASKEENKEDATKLAKMLQALDSLPQPTMCLTQGSVYGGGLGIVACSDIVLAAEDSTFCFSEVKLGLIPAIVSPYVYRAMGEKYLRRYMLTAEPFPAKEALRMGLVHEVSDPKKLEKLKVDILNRIKQNAPTAVRLAKRLLLTLSEEPAPMRGKVEWTSELLAEVRSQKEAIEGLAAFLEKRTPAWK